jgi:hypothetical protein
LQGKIQVSTRHRYCVIANYGRWKVTFNLAAPSFRVRSVKSHRLRNDLHNGKSRRSVLSSGRRDSASTKSSRCPARELAFPVCDTPCCDVHTPMSIRSMGLTSSGHPRPGSGGPTGPLRHRRPRIADSGAHAPRRNACRRTRLGLRAVSGPRELRADARLRGATGCTTPLGPSREMF